ncbi:MAG: alpha/beta fold hydrolase [Elusimicrobiota bacterium]
MTAIVWLWILLPLLAIGLVAGAWYGSNTVFHPPRMLQHTVFPEQFGLHYEKISFPGSDGLILRGWLIPAASPTDRTILCTHGWGDNKGDLLQRLHFLAEHYNLVLFDSRAHGESEGAYSTIGYLESFDFEAAVRHLKEVRPAWTRRLGVFGLSMGAAMAIHGMAHHPEFRCAALESPFRSFNRVVTQFTWSGYWLPYFPFAWITLLCIRLRLGADSEPYSPVHHIRGLPPLPLLFIAGEKDALMPLSEVRALHDMAGEPKEIWVVPEATHGRCQEFAPEEYARRVLDFFRKNL